MLSIFKASTLFDDFMLFDSKEILRSDRNGNQIRSQPVYYSKTPGFEKANSGTKATTCCFQSTPTTYGIFKQALQSKKNNPGNRQ
jgi:hypothetical protein